jgi:hypothetical protein
MARALAGAALAGAAAMARVATPAAARPSTAPLSVSSPEPPNSNPFGLTQVTRGETHDTSPSRVPGSGRSRGGAADEATPSPDPRAATSLRNSVASDASAPAGASAGPSPRRVPVATTRATELRDAARRLAREEAAAKEAFRPQITARARALRRPGDFGERLHENASAKEGGTDRKVPGDGDERRRSRRRARFGAERVRDALRGGRAGAPEGEGARGAARGPRVRPGSRKGGGARRPCPPGARTVAATRRRRLRSEGWTCAGIPPRLERDATRARPTAARGAACRRRRRAPGRPGGTTSSSGS